MTVSEMARMGGHASAKARSPEERRRIALKAVNARWKRYREEKERMNYKDPDAQYLEDWWTIEAMMTYGGSFVKLLGKAARNADLQNLARIKHGWPEYWEEYKSIGQRMKEKAVSPISTP